MTDADTVRALLLEMGNGDTTPEEYDAGLAALDRLVAERDAETARADLNERHALRLEESCERMVAERDRLREALEFYASASTYDESGTPDPARWGTGVIPIHEDQGVIARRALEVHQ